MSSVYLFSLVLTFGSIFLYAEETENVYDCIIIGAGWAGMAAANKLKSEGFDNFVVLEAQDRIGGRSHTSYKFGDSIPHDIGSYYLTSTNSNPLMEILNLTSLNPTVQDTKLTLVASNGTVFSEDLYDELFEKYWIPFYGGAGYEDDRVELYEAAYIHNLRNEAMEEISLLESFDDYYYYDYAEEDFPLRKVIDEYVNITNITEGEEGLSFFYNLVERFVTSDYGGSTDDLSFFFWDLQEWYDGDNLYLSRKRKPKKKRVTVDRGFKVLVDKYAEPIIEQIELESKVTAINYDSFPIEVTYEGTEGVSTSKAKNVIVTVPVGVLKAGTIEFTPDLDDGADYLGKGTDEYATKKYALDHIGPGKILHCALYWENMTASEIFWPTDKSFIQHNAPKPSAQGRFTQWINFYMFNGNVPILMGTVNGNHVDSMMNMTDEEVATEAVEKLRSVYGDENVPNPSNFLVKNWLNDENIRGAYSYTKPGNYFPRYYLKRSLPGLRPPNNILNFAGEATSEDQAGTVHGAVQEGKRAARGAISNLIYNPGPIGLRGLIQMLLVRLTSISA